MFNELATEIHEWAREHGFWEREALGDGQPNPSIASEKLLLVVSEVAEAQSALRDGDFVHEAEEIADTVIRLLDYAAWRGIDLDHEVTRKVRANHNRPRLHGRADFPALNA